MPIDTGPLTEYFKRVYLPVPGTELRFGALVVNPGHSRAIVEFHGWMAQIARHGYETLDIAIRDLALAFPERTVIFIEPPGTGGSSSELEFVADERELMRHNFGFCDLELAYALRAAGIEEVDLVGLSQGAHFAAKLARIAPTAGLEVRNLVVSAGLMRKRPYKVLRKLFTSPKSRRERAAIAKESQSLEVREATKLWKIALVEVGWHLIAKGNYPRSNRYGRMLADTDLPQDLLAIAAGETSIHLLIGDQDHVAPYEEYVSLKDAGLPVTVIKGGTHAAVSGGDPALILPHIIDFLR